MTNLAEMTGLELVLGEMPEVPCDGVGHGDHPTHDSGPGAHYFQFMHTCRDTPAGTVEARCQRKSEDLFHTIGSRVMVCCLLCGRLFGNGKRWMRYVGPVGK